MGRYTFSAGYVGWEACWSLVARGRGIAWAEARRGYFRQWEKRLKRVACLSRSGFS
ncbi:hypothetical protein EMIT0158MI4_80256 [Burkholderia ambifaria]